MAVRKRSVSVEESLAARVERPRCDVAVVPHLWHHYGMARTRISTTVDADLLANARRSHDGMSDSELIDDALAALLARRRATEVDAAYAAAYAAHPIDEADEWGDLDSFRSAAAAT